jgi:hypothetical protein
MPDVSDIAGENIPPLAASVDVTNPF